MGIPQLRYDFLVVKNPTVPGPPQKKGAEQKITTPKTGAETVSLKYPLHRKLSASRDGDKQEIAQNALVGKPKQKRPNTEKTRRLEDGGFGSVVHHVDFVVV